MSSLLDIFSLWNLVFRDSFLILRPWLTNCLDLRLRMFGDVNPLNLDFRASMTLWSSRLQMFSISRVYSSGSLIIIVFLTIGGGLNKRVALTIFCGWLVLGEDTLILKSASWWTDARSIFNGEIAVKLFFMLIEFILCLLLMKVVFCSILASIGFKMILCLTLKLFYKRMSKILKMFIALMS